MAEPCGIVDVGCTTKNAIEGFMADAMDNLAKAILDALSQMVTSLSTFWVTTPTVPVTVGGEGARSAIVSAVNDELMLWTLSLAVLSVIIGGIRMIWEQRGAPLKDLLRSLITLTLVTGLGVWTISILVIAADAFAVAIINKSTDGTGFADAMTIMTAVNGADTAIFIMIVLGLIGLIASLCQIVLMVVRSGMLVILAGILPTTAAFTNTEMGKQWFQKAVGWAIAFILYKPAAAIVYAVAFMLMGSDGGLIGSITGFTLMIVALFALPALMRFVTPMVGAVASGAGGGAAGAAAAAGAMATGAVSLGRLGSGRGNSAPQPSSSPSKSNTQTSAPSGTNGLNGGQGPSSTGPQGPSSTGPQGPSSTGTGGTGGTVPKTSPSPSPGPLGVVAVGAQVASEGLKAVQNTAQDSTGEGPSGSN